MPTREVLTRYYRYANSAQWDLWCDLFAETMVMDEQLAGRIEGRDKLRSMMTGMGELYASFQNQPLCVLVDEDQAAVVSRITARSASGNPIEAAVMNYFRIENGLIAYMANYHDTLPFQVLSQS
ncbi:nuclear transport factor 2 family protein [Streptomyces sp. NPDC093060]|uniref:nuclear transport factor 2 family protein n=1 Tax=Streptomyces sp. NPDC093060 TaxID=3366019 RepID=UPI003828ECE1